MVYAHLNQRREIDDIIELRPEQAQEFPDYVALPLEGAGIGCRLEEDGVYRDQQRLLSLEEYWIAYAQQVGEGLDALLDDAGEGQELAVAAALWEEENG